MINIDELIDGLIDWFSTRRGTVVWGSYGILYNLISNCPGYLILVGTSNTRKHRSRHVQLAMASLIFFDNREGEFMQLSLHKIFWKDVIADIRFYNLRQ